MKKLIRDENYNYFYDGKKVLGVNEVLQKIGIIDYNFVDKIILKNASDFGTNVHKATAFEDINDLNYETLSPELLPYVESWKIFKKLYNIKYKKSEIEVMLYSKRFDFAGTLDRLPIPINGIMTLIDIKTNSSTMPKYYALTTGAYQTLFEENYGIKIKKRWCVQLIPNSPPKIHKYEMQFDAHNFLICLEAVKIKEIYK